MSPVHDPAPLRQLRYLRDALLLQWLPQAALPFLQPARRGGKVPQMPRRLRLPGALQVIPVPVVGSDLADGLLAICCRAA